MNLNEVEDSFFLSSEEKNGDRRVIFSWLIQRVLAVNSSRLHETKFRTR